MREEKKGGGRIEINECLKKFTIRILRAFRNRKMGMKNLEKKYTFWNSVENFSLKKIIRWIKKKKGF